MESNNKSIRFVKTIHPEQQYLSLLEDVMTNGYKKPVDASASSTQTIHKGLLSETTDVKYLYSVVGRTVRYDLRKGFPVYTSKKVAWKTAFKEMLWFLTGEGDVAALQREKVSIWNGWAYKKYLKQGGKLTYEYFVEEILKNADDYKVPLSYSEMTAWETGKGETIDQTRWVVDGIKKSPERKSYVVSSWNPARIYEMARAIGNESVVLAPCHYSHQLIWCNNALNMVLNIRSNDLPLGHPFNVAQYAMLLKMYCHCTGLEAGELIVNIGDAHIYSDQMEALTQQLENPLYEFPTLEIKDRGQKYLTDFVIDDFTLIGYHSNDNIEYPLTVVGGH